LQHLGSAAAVILVVDDRGRPLITSTWPIEALTMTKGLASSRAGLFNYDDSGPQESSAQDSLLISFFVTGEGPGLVSIQAPFFLQAHHEIDEMSALASVRLFGDGFTGNGYDVVGFNVGLNNEDLIRQSTLSISRSLTDPHRTLVTVEAEALAIAKTAHVPEPSSLILLLGSALVAWLLLALYTTAKPPRRTVRPRVTFNGCYPLYIGTQRMIGSQRLASSQTEDNWSERDRKFFLNWSEYGGGK